MTFLRALFIILFAAATHTVQADMMKCAIKKGNQTILNYFENTDKAQRKKCVNKPITVMTSTAQSTTKKAVTASGYRTNKDTTKFEPLAAKNIKPMSCHSKGGTVSVNGKTFHLDTNALCRRYGSKHKGSIAQGKSSHIKLSKVATNFRKKISGYVNRIARQHGLEPAFIHAIISAESAYQPNATSSVGAMGLMQLMPFTAERFGVANAYDPHQNIAAGAKYLKLLLNEFGSLELAAAGYNAGEGAVRKYNNRIPPYKETINYVPKVMAYYRQYKKNHRLIAAK